MTGSMFASLLNMLDSRIVGEVAHALGQPEQSVSRGMESSIAAVLAGLASKSNDSNALKKTLDLVPSTAGAISWPQMVGSVADPNSSLMAVGKRLLPALLGSAENTVTSGVSRASSLSPGATTTLLTMAGPVVVSFVAKRTRDEAMTMGSLGSLLQRESSTIRSALPSGLGEIFWPGTAQAAAAASPVIAQAVQKEKSANWVLPALVAAALALGLVWLFAHSRRPPVRQATSAPTGEASRVATPARGACTLPTNMNLQEGGIASRLLGFLQNPDAKSIGPTWLNANQLSFDTGSARLRPESQAQLNDLAVVLVNCPSVRLTVAGYTDTVGTPETNLRLSRNRANSVVAVLVRKGVSADRLSAEGRGEQEPIADNATTAGRAQNRRVAILATQD